jgi:hypothetical protein
MNLSRRSFLQGCVAASGLATIGAAAAPSDGDREYYELRCYRMGAGTRLKQDPNPQLLDRFLESALMPALNRLNIGNVGVFTELEVDRKALTSKQKERSPFWVLIPHRDLASFVKVSELLQEDSKLLEAGTEYLRVPVATPAFERIDTWLLRAFKSIPRIEVPPFSRNKVETRVFEMRTYESYSEDRALAKMAMFDDGETELMRSLGMFPVFFGQGLAGPDLPHLTYITSGQSLESHFQAWAKFGPDPRWIAIKDLPKYAHSVSKNVPRFLAPRPYSQI